MFSLYVVDAVVTVAFLLLLYLISRRSRLPLPPGPPAEPILGHARLIPKDAPEYTYREWAKQYGDVLFLHVLGKPIIVLNSAQSAVSLLDRKADNYSDRPTFTQFELMGWRDTVSFMRWNSSRFQMHRRLLSSFLTKQKIVKFQELQRLEARKLVQRLIQRPKDFTDIAHGWSTAIIMQLSYGHDVSSLDDLYVRLVNEAVWGLNNCGSPGNTSVDIFPWLQYLPSWLCWSSSVKFALSSSEATRKFHEIPFADVQQRMRDGTATYSFIQHFLEQVGAGNNKSGKFSGLEERDIRGAAATIYGGECPTSIPAIASSHRSFIPAGESTTTTTILVFILCMVLNPGVQRKAQAEIDAIIGNERLPEFSDRASLPYVEWILQETYRWHPPLPLGIPHRSIKDDIYNDMLIPKNSLVFANILSICYDEAVYKDPHKFDPSRFAPADAGGAGEPFPIGHFGFGRRVCPGRHLADASIWIAIATTLATMTIGLARAQDGSAVAPRVVFSTGLSSHPEPFDCTIRPRSEHACELVSNACEG